MQESGIIARVIRRHRPLTPDRLDEAQRSLYRTLLSGPRAGSGAGRLVSEDGSLVGPFGAMLLSPRVGDRLQELGAVLRFEGGLPDPVRELAILVVAKVWDCGFEWQAHEPLALRAGVPPELIEQVGDGAVPTASSTGLATVARAVEELLSERRWSDGRFADLSTVLSEAEILELIVLCGYYSSLAMILNGLDLG